MWTAPWADVHNNYFNWDMIRTRFSEAVQVWVLRVFGPSCSAQQASNRASKVQHLGVSCKTNAERPSQLFQLTALAQSTRGTSLPAG